MISGTRLTQLIQAGTIGVQPFLPEHVSGAALKLHLGQWFQVPQGKQIDLDTVVILPEPIKIEATELQLLPNQFVLAQTMERITIPEGFVGWVETCGPAANVGLQAHLCDGHLDPGVDDYVWIQLKNQSDHPLVLRHGTYIAKMYVHELV
jgi:dCTP deaminase